MKIGKWEFGNQQEKRKNDEKPKNDDNYTLRKSVRISVENPKTDYEKSVDRMREELLEENNLETLAAIADYWAVKDKQPGPGTDEEGLKRKKEERTNRLLGLIGDRIFSGTEYVDEDKADKVREAQIQFIGSLVDSIPSDTKKDIINHLDQAEM